MNLMSKPIDDDVNYVHNMAMLCYAMLWLHGRVPTYLIISKRNYAQSANITVDARVFSATTASKNVCTSCTTTNLFHIRLINTQLCNAIILCTTLGPSVIRFLFVHFFSISCAYVIDMSVNML